MVKQRHRHHNRYLAFCTLYYRDDVDACTLLLYHYRIIYLQFQKPLIIFFLDTLHKPFIEGFSMPTYKKQCTKYKSDLNNPIKGYNYHVQLAPPKFL